MSTRFTGLIAVAVLIVSATSFTAQELPRTPRDVPPPPDAPLPASDRPASASIRFDFRAGMEKADHRIIWQRDGVEFEVTRVAIGPGPGLELIAVSDGMEVRSSAFNTVCKSSEIRPSMMGADARYLPSSKSSGYLHISRLPHGRAEVTCQDFRFECTKLVLAGEKNRLEINPGPEGLQLTTKDAQIRAVSASVNYQTGFHLTIDATTVGDKANAGQKIRLAQQP